MHQADLRLAGVLIGLQMRWTLMALLLLATAAHAAIDPAVAKSAFDELRGMCDRAAGKPLGL